MKKILFTLFALVLASGIAAQIPEPDFIGEVLAIHSDGTAEKLEKNAGTTERDGRNDAKRLCTNVVTVSDEVKPKKRKMQGKAEYSRRTVCKSLPKKM